MSVSIAMAVYNGEKYIEEQITSILNQLGNADELVISYQNSTDNTFNIISKFLDDKRVKLIMCETKGVLNNFESALKNCQNEIIFLADQDDIWKENKVKVVSNIFDNHSKINIVLHDAEIYMENEGILNDSLFEKRNAKPGFIHNIIKNSYTGCCMAIKKDFLKKVLPFPKRIPMHDQWIGVISDIYHSSYFLNESLITYRRHANNVSSFKRGSICDIIIKRTNLIYALLKKFI